MKTPDITPLDVDPKTEKKIKSLRKSMEQIVIFTLIGCIIPLLWPFLIVFGPIYALQRRSLLKNPVIRDWLDANAHVPLKNLAEFTTTEGGVARIQISGWRPWIPVVLPIVACVVMIGLSSFL
jgi:hypothetical protein